jgi:hypothetical protein
LVALTIPWKLMAILIVNNLEQPQGLVLGERVLIGRRPFNTIMVPDPEVSRIHAWIGRRDGRYLLFDAGSRSGTRLNDRTVGSSPRALADGDEIRIGPATILFMEADELPVDVAEIEAAPVPPAADPYDGGIYFDCACGGPMWVTANLAGQMGKCRYCGERLVVPHMSGKMARPLAPAAVILTAPVRRPPEMAAGRAPGIAPGMPVARGAEVAAPVEAEEPQTESTEAPCSICQTPIVAGEERTTCPSCHLTFHAGCWQENYGCSAYGCDQVNVLAPAAEPAAAVAGPMTTSVMPVPMPVAEAAVTVDMEGRPPFPWEPVLLALSFVASALGALLFGIPSGVMLVCVLAFLVVGKPRRRGLVVVALLVTLAGAAAGYATSMFWWKGQRVWEVFLK